MFDKLPLHFVKNFKVELEKETRTSKSANSAQHLLLPNRSFPAVKAYWQDHGGASIVNMEIEGSRGDSILTSAAQP
jgi:hypothetical protein